MRKSSRDQSVNESSDIVAGVEKRKPGRPRKHPKVESVTKRPRGRPRKQAVDSPGPDNEVLPAAQAAGFAPIPQEFVYTEAMRERALKRIVKRLEMENTELVFKRYMEVMFKFLMKRIDRARAAGELEFPSWFPQAAEIPPIEETKQRRSRRSRRGPKNGPRTPS